VESGRPTEKWPKTRSTSPPAKRASRCARARLALHGSPGPQAASRERYAAYGTDGTALEALERADPGLAAPLREGFPATRAQVVYAAREELARTVDDVLARRTRALFLDVAAARAAAPAVAALLAVELSRDATWEREQVATFDALAREVAPG
jgi:glycerol-3-phosphate dehydrogenase